MSYKIRVTRSAREDLKRLYRLLVEQDIVAARKALGTLTKATDLLAEFPFSCRKADAANPFLRELVVSFGVAGYVMLFEIEDNQTVTILTVRHQREDDYF